MTCHMTDPERISGDGTGRLICRTECVPNTPCEAGPLRLMCAILTLLDDDIAVVKFNCNDAIPQTGTVYLGTSVPAHFTYEHSEPMLAFIFKLHFPDDAGTYAVDDVWHWEQVID